MLKSRQSPSALRRLFGRLAPGIFGRRLDEELSQPCADGMRDLCSGLVVGFPKAGKSRRVRVCDWERQVLFADLAENVIGEDAPEHRSCANAPAIVAAEGDDVRSEPMEPRQRVSGHAHHSIPLRLELDLADLGKCLLEHALRPGAVDLETSEAQRADAAEEKASGLIETERVHDETSVPAALAAWQD